MDPITAGLIAGGVSAVAGLYTSKKQRQAQERANQQNIEYNSPVAQMQRLKEANLNPNLVYSSGNVVGNTEIKPVDSYGEGQAVQNALSEYMSIRNGSADIRNKENQADLFDATLPSTVQQAKATALRVQADSEIASEQARKAKAEADIAEHDARIITNKDVGYTSKDNGLGGSINAMGRSLGTYAKKFGSWIADKIYR